MPVTLDKTPRPFTVLLLDGKVFGITPTPESEDDRDALYMEACWGMCLDLVEVSAIDRYDAWTKGAAVYARSKAIAQYADTFGVSDTVAETVYRDCRHWAITLGRRGRASWHATGLRHYAAIKRFALTEVMREHGEL